MVAQQEASLSVMMKGKRTKRPRPSSPVLCLATDEGDSSSVEWAGPRMKSTEEEEDMAHCLILLARGSKLENNINDNNNKGTTSSYECKTCNKSFLSFQALGGHRASHKKPKLVTDPDHLAKTSPIFFSLLNGQHQYDHQYNEEEISLSLQIANATTINTTTNNSNSNNHATTNNNSNNKTNKVHECGICGAEFSSGQALGGHMRRHRPIGGVPNNTSHSQNVQIANASPKIQVEKDQQKTKNLLSLDLNLPASAQEEDNNHYQHQQLRDSSYIFPSKEKTLVFSTSSLVDCHY